MSTPVGKRPLSQSTPSPSSCQVKKILKMTDSAEGMGGLQAHSQVANSQVFSQVSGGPVDTSHNSGDAFLQLFNATEANARDMVAGKTNGNLYLNLSNQ